MQAENADSFALNLLDSVFDGRRHRDHLASDRVSVFHAGGTDISGRDLKPPGDLAHEILGPHIALFDPKIKELALAARLIGGDFLNFKIFGGMFDSAADARQIGG